MMRYDHSINVNVNNTNESIWDDATLRGRVQGVGQTTMGLLSFYKLFFISIIHMLSLVLVKSWLKFNGMGFPVDNFEYRSVSYDLLGLFNSLVEYHRNVMVLSALVAFAVLFSVLLSLQMV